jgi:DNA-binding MarR family transcriptional regulator
MRKNKKALIQHIIEISDKIYHALSPNIPMEYLSSDLTVAQLRILLLLHTDGPSKMSSIASTLQVALSTATGVIDNLVKKELVVREANPQDRRLVICKLSPAGQELINKLWVSGEFQMEKLLDGLMLEQLEKAAEVAEMLYDNVSPKTSKQVGDGTK